MLSKVPIQKISIALAMKICSFTFIAFFVSISCWGGSLVTLTEQKIQVSQEVLKSWSDDLYETNEVWVVSDVTGFLNELREVGLVGDLHSELLSHIKTGLDLEIKYKVLTFYRYKSTDRFIVVPLEFKQKLSKSILSVVYRHLLKNAQAPNFLVFQTAREAREFFLSITRDPFAANKMLEDVYTIDKRQYYFLTPEIWADLPEAVKAKRIDWYLEILFSKYSYQAEISFSNESEIKQIARQYSNKPKVVERYLRRLLDKNSGLRVDLPLKNILPPFIRAVLNTFTSCSGPNCFNAARNVGRERAYEQKYEGPETRFLEVMQQSYDQLSPDDQLKFGDVLIYFNLAGDLVHASVYLDEEIVFSKLGFSKFNPYVIEGRLENEERYFPARNFKLMPMRLRSSLCEALLK